MGSRLRENPRRLLECWCEVVGPRDDNAPWIIQKFPNNYNKEEILKSVPQFAFPCAFESTNVQHFSFVLTSLDSKWTYGFCRHAPGAETALVLLSHLPWHETFYKLLNTLSEMMSSGRVTDLSSCLQNIYKFKVPHPGSEITVPYGDNKFFVAQCPNHLKLPTIPENRNLSEYYNAVDANNMMIIFASMLYERRIIVVSKRLSRLSACVQAANSVIYPMQWQHIFIPVLPQHLLDYLLAPMPFLIGVNTSLMLKVQMDDIGDAVILDADNNTVKTPFNDVETLPDEVVTNLKRNLKSPSNMLGDCVARAFLRALVQLIGNYKVALQFREDDSKITFNREKFVSIRPPHLQPFVEKMLELQIFQQFIEERLDRLNSGKQTSDEFELEVSVHCEKSSSKVKQQYKQFVTNVRKEGGAIMKTVKSKTNPAVKSAVKSVTKGGKQVKEKSRQTYKDIRGKIKDFQQPRLDDENMSPPWMNGDSPPKPRSAPSSPVLGVKRRPQTVNSNLPHFSAKATYKRASQFNIRDDTSVLPGTRKYDIIETGPGLMSPGSNDSLSTPSPQSIDLMEEMEEVMRSKLGQDVVDGDKTRHKSGSTGGSSKGSVGNGVAPGYATLQLPPKDPASILAAKKQMSASLTSLPLIDLSLDIELPPPILGYSFPVSFDHNNGGGEEGRDSVGSCTSHYRSPKLLHDDREITTTTITPTKDIEVDTASAVETSNKGHSQISPRSSSRPSHDVSTFSAVCKGYATTPRSRSKPRKCCDSSGDECPPPFFACRPSNNDTFSSGTCPASSVLSARKCEPRGHVCNPSHSRRGTSNIDVEPATSSSSGLGFPKYGASQAFSASLSKYSSKGGTPGYFYSKLTQSVDNKSLVAEFEAIENEDDNILCSPVNIPPTTVSSLNQPGYAGNVLFFSSASRPVDIMTMSLPTVLTSLSPPPPPSHTSVSPIPYFPSSPSMSHSLPYPSSLQPGSRSKSPDPYQQSLSPLPPPPPSLGRRTRSPSPHLGLDQGSGGEEDGQDLIFLESPQDEIFDPLFNKDLPSKPLVSGRPSQPPPPVPGSVRSTSSLPGVKVQGEGDAGLTSQSASQLPDHPSLARASAINTIGLPNATPKRPPSHGSEYRPFSSLQTSLGAPVGCQNPMYPQHVPTGGPSSGGPSPLSSNTRGGSAAAAFASTLLSEGQRSPRTPAPGQYVQFEPLCKTAANTSTQPQRPPRLSQRDLLGDFDKDFQKLSVNSPWKTQTLGNNNDSVVNNNKMLEPKSDSNGPSDSHWATFD